LQQPLPFAYQPVTVTFQSFRAAYAPVLEYFRKGQPVVFAILPDGFPLDIHAVPPLALRMGTHTRITISGFIFHDNAPRFYLFRQLSWTVIDDK
jgi:hypothetical protein